MCAAALKPSGDLPYAQPPDGARRRFAAAPTRTGIYSSAQTQPTGSGRHPVTSARHRCPVVLAIPDLQARLASAHPGMEPVPGLNFQLSLSSSTSDATPSPKSSSVATSARTQGALLAQFSRSADSLCLTLTVARAGWPGLRFYAGLDQASPSGSRPGRCPHHPRDLGSRTRGSGGDHRGCAAT